MILIDELRQKHGLANMLNISSLKRSTYYHCRSKTDKDEKNIRIIEQIKQIFSEHKQKYGYRRITLELRNRGYTINHKKVKRLMNKLGLYARVPKTKYKSYRGEISKTCKNLLLSKDTDNKGRLRYKREFDVNVMKSGRLMYLNLR